MEPLIWTDRSRCLGVPNYIFFTEELEDIAKGVCAGCPVRKECLEYAINTGQEHGVWGGLTESERQKRLKAAIPGGVAPTDVTYTTNARSTGATCSAGRSETGWSVICRPHGSVATAPNRTVAEFAVSRPEEWCPTCRRIADGELPKLVALR